MFYEADARFWPIVPFAKRLCERRDWPAPAELAGVLKTPVTFAEPPFAGKSAGAYDASIVERREVLTRPRHWHDLFNAFVWCVFPKTKAALHERQYACIRERVVDGMAPNARTREQDALALFDEGGVVRVDGESETFDVIFGHSLYETMLHDRLLVHGAHVRVGVESTRLTAVTWQALLDERLSYYVSSKDRFQSPTQFDRIDLNSLRNPSWISGASAREHHPLG